MKGRIVRTSVSLPSDLVKELDRFVDSIKSDRSKVVQQAIRNFLSIPHKEGDMVSGSLTIVYSHDEHGLEEELTDIQHRFVNLVVSNLHIHLDEHRCMLTIFVKGGFNDVQSLIRRITGRRGVLMVKESLVRL
ncbi:MAG: CopG family ribbon-helix-helix protein [Candidatus Brockarchaeota archaeon]|nr:CopG family ribbon-helix-helix protein [Candidatus Brockarchaeota archaeon]